MGESLYIRSAASAEIRYAVNTSAGRKYRVTLELERSTDVEHAYIDVRNIAQVSNTYTEAKATGHYTIDFMANSETMNIVVQVQGTASVSKYITVDNFKIEEVVSDVKGYRYAFNGKEKDDETYGDGNEYDYGFRIYNPRLGRFLSVDPLTKTYPMLTPYQFASNTPIQALDVDGREGYQYVETLKQKDGSTCSKRIVEIDIHVATSTQAGSVHYHPENITEIQAHLNNEYNNGTGFKDANNLDVEFRFNVSSFDADKTSPQDMTDYLNGSRSNKMPSESGVTILKGGVIQRQGGGTIDQGETNPRTGLTSISKSAVDPSHTVGHETAHKFLRYKENANNPESDGQHQTAGGIFQRRILDQNGNETQSTKPLNKANVDMILKTVPKANDKTIEE